MPCDKLCLAQMLIDIIALGSARFYIAVILVMWPKRPFGGRFTIIATNLIIANLSVGLINRFIYAFPARNWFRLLTKIVF